MASAEDVKKLAALARISIPEEKLETFAKEFDDILIYISQLEKLNITIDTKVLPPVRNVFRDDINPHEAGKYTEALTMQFPDREGDSLKVKQIITHD